MPKYSAVSALLEDPEGAREVLASFVPRIACTPFGAGHGREYDFKGLGEYGALFGETPAPRGVPDGPRQVVARALTVPVRGLARAA